MTPYYFTQPYEFNQYNPSIINAAIIGALVCSLCIYVIFYIFEAIGLYKMSKNRGYRSAWVSFIPVVNMFVLGGIADNINACYNKKSYWRVWALVLNLFSTFMGVAVCTVVVSKLPEMIASIIDNAMGGGFGAGTYILNILTPIVLFSLFGSLFSIAFLIIRYICLYRVFQDYTTPTNSILFLILSIFLGISQFFVFALRNKPSASLYYRFNAAQNTQNGPYPPQQPSGSVPPSPPGI